MFVLAMFKYYKLINRIVSKEHTPVKQGTKTFTLYKYDVSILLTLEFIRFRNWQYDKLRSSILLTLTIFMTSNII